MTILRWNAHLSLRRALLLQFWFASLIVRAQPVDLDIHNRSIKDGEHDIIIHSVEDINVSDFNFNFDHGVHEYYLEAERCINYLEVLFKVPSWIATIPKEYYAFIGTGNEVDLLTSDTGKGTTPKTSSAKNPDGSNPKDKTDVVSSVEKALIMPPGYVSKDVGKLEDQGTAAEVYIKVNGEDVNREDCGYMRCSLQCGHTNDINIDMTIVKAGYDDMQLGYTLHIDVPLTGDNHMVVLEVSHSDGRLETVNPQLSRAYRNHAVTVEHVRSVTFMIYAECLDGLPIIGEQPGKNTATIHMPASSDKSDITIKCGEKKGENGILLEETEYNLRLERSTSDDALMSFNVISLVDGIVCPITAEESARDSNITCTGGGRRYSPLVFETQEDQKFYVPMRYVVDGYIKELHAYDEEYIHVKAGVPTPVMNLRQGIVVYVTKGKTVKRFELRFEQKGINRQSYSSVLYVLIGTAYLSTLLTTLVPQVIKAHTGVVFDTLPVIICAHGDESTKNICWKFPMLPNMIEGGKRSLFMMINFYKTMAIVVGLVYLVAAFKKRTQQQSQEKDVTIHRYLPIRDMVCLFAFPWSFLNLSLILAPLFGGYEPPAIFLDFIKVRKRENVSPIPTITWSTQIRMLLAFPMLVVGVFLLYKACNTLFKEIKTTHKEIQEGNIVWIAECENDPSVFYSYYDEQDPDELESFIEALNSYPNRGYWTYRSCQVLTTQFSKTIMSAVFPFIRRNYAVVAAYVKEVDLGGKDEPYNKEVLYTNTNVYDQLQEGSSSQEFDIPEVIQVNPGDNIMGPRAKFKINGRIQRNQTLDETTHDAYYNSLYKTFDADMVHNVQVYRLCRIEATFKEDIIAKVETRFITFFVTERIISSLYRLDGYFDCRKPANGNLFIHATTRQLFPNDDHHNVDIGRNAMFPLYRSFAVLSKYVNGSMACIVTLIPDKRLLSYAITGFNLITTIFAIVKQPYTNPLDNYFSHLCAGIGLYYMVYGHPDGSNRQAWITVSIFLILVVLYAACASLMLFVDIVAVFTTTTKYINQNANVKIVVRDMNDEVVDVIFGYSKTTVKVVRVTLEDDNVSLQEQLHNDRFPIIAVYMEHINDNSSYLPYITISYISSAKDVFVINRSQVNRQYLKNYFYSRLKRRTSRALAKRMIDYVEGNPQYSCFNFQMPL